MPNSKVAAGQAVTSAKANEITIGTTAPSVPTLGWVWVDTSTTTPVLKVWNGSAWVAAGVDSLIYFSIFRW